MNPERFERWSDRFDVFDRRSMLVIGGFFAATAIANFSERDWGEGSAWLCTAVWAGTAYMAKRSERRTNDAMRMLRELAQLPPGDHVVVDTGGQFVIGKYVKQV